MFECPSCGKKHRPGTLFCTECGIYLPTGGTLRTTPLPTDQLPRTPTSQRKSTAPDQEQQKTTRTLFLEVAETGRQVELPDAPELLLGREDAAHGIMPDLDLAPDGGLESGVSRRHAKIFQQEGRFLIEDVGSANGTFLNSKRLTPYLPYPLNEGDTVQLGQLQLKVNLR
jgi:pSer/pThr/pTyr-binding forkhead associated (FHA) protein